jgi:molybdenum-dependent DNA-binding transcriptional regulator ModE
MTRLTIRIDFGNGAALGLDKVKLLELVAQTGSIHKAAAGMKMSYR